MIDSEKAGSVHAPLRGMDAFLFSQGGVGSRGHVQKSVETDRDDLRD
jgi:hypothetical protein